MDTRTLTPSRSNARGPRDKRSPERGQCRRITRKVFNNRVVKVNKAESILKLPGTKGYKKLDWGNRDVWERTPKVTGSMLSLYVQEGTHDPGAFFKEARQGYEIF